MVAGRSQINRRTFARARLYSISRCTYARATAAAAATREVSRYSESCDRTSEVPSDDLTRFHSRNRRSAKSTALDKSRPFRPKIDTLFSSSRARQVRSIGRWPVTIARPMTRRRFHRFLRVTGSRNSHRFTSVIPAAHAFRHRRSIWWP